MLLMKNAQFLTKSAETLAILPSLEVVVFTKFHYNWAKIVDFSLIAYFGDCPFYHSLVSNLKSFQSSLFE